MNEATATLPPPVLNVKADVADPNARNGATGSKTPSEAPEATLAADSKCDASRVTIPGTITAGQSQVNDDGGENPKDWFNKKFPTLAEKHGAPLDIYTPKNQNPRVMDTNESYLAATLSEEAMPNSPTVYLRGENRFYTYDPVNGIFAVATEEKLSERLSQMLLTCARACRESADVAKLEFGFRDTSALAGVIKRAKALLCVPDDYFQRDMTEFLPVGNGVLRIADKVLLPFAPSYRFRNKICVNYNPVALCPLFENVLLAPSLEAEDVKLLMCWCGLVLCGRNVSQKILLLTGTAGAGKGTFIRILKTILGEANVGSLRTDQLDQRFELGLHVGRTLLYGADVPANFLSGVSASKLKAYTGGDPLTAELKGSNSTVSMQGDFNVVATSNSRLTVHLEGDVAAWLRRLLNIRYEKPKPEKVVPDLDRKILEQESSGVLNLMLEGLFELRANSWQFKLTSRQQERINELLLESDSVNVFFREQCLADSQTDGMTVTDAHAAYSEFCFQRGWNPVARQNFGKEAPEAVQQLFHLSMRHDIKGADNRRQRGWKLRLRAADDITPD